MEYINILENSNEMNGKPITITKVLETPFSKEIRICIAEGHTMKEHQAPYDIVIMIVKGNIDFAVNGDMHKLKKVICYIWMQKYHIRCLQ